MQLRLDTNTDGTVVQAYDKGIIKVNGQTFSSSLILTSTAVETHWTPQVVTELETTHLLQLLDSDPEVVLLGTGERLRFPDVQLLAAVTAKGVGIEVMDTGSACRTFNILASEGRRVTAGLLPI